MSSDLVIHVSDIQPVTPSNILKQLDTGSIQDIFSAYRLSRTGLNVETEMIYLHQLSLQKKTFPYLLEVIISNRYPYKIMLTACKLGMYVPPQMRTGLQTYRFFIQNIQYYEKIFERSNQPVPNLYEIYSAQDPVQLLMKFHDNEILRSGYKFDRNYTNRKKMIQNFVQNNISIHGKFKFESNSRKSYSSKAQIITYTEPGQKLLYSAKDLLKLFDLPQRKLWKDPQKSACFNQLSLHHLRQQILEKCEQWKHRDGVFQFTAPPELSRILENLEKLLVNDIRNDTGAYLGNPQLSVSF